MSWHAFIERVLRFKPPPSSLSAKDQAVLDRVTARITGIHQSHYMLGLLGADDKELNCQGYTRMSIGPSLIGAHSATFGPLSIDVTVVAGVVFAPRTGELITKVNVQNVFKSSAGCTINFNFDLRLG